MNDWHYAYLGEIRVTPVHGEEMVLQVYDRWRGSVRDRPASISMVVKTQDGREYPFSLPVSLELKLFCT